MTKMNGLDLIETVLPTLKPAEMEKLRALLQVKVDNCALLGHRFRKAGVQTRWLLPPRIILYCDRCGMRSYC